MWNKVIVLLRFIALETNEKQERINHASDLQNESNKTSMENKAKHFEFYF